MKDISVTVPLNEEETITIAGTLTQFDITNQADSGSRGTIGRFEGGKWFFDSPNQERLFFNLFDSHRQDFHMAVEFFRSQAK